ncbi:MAG: aminotransferase class I/II-fold pyridoxal phosphate-dependent enzyme, partial [Methyloligellaceae bacterium]
MEMLLAPRMERFKRSPTNAITQRARELRAAGRDVVTVSSGEPDFDTPDHIKEAAKAALDQGATKYTTVDGTPELKAAVAAKFAQENALDYATDQISVGTGGKQVIFNALLATVDDGDEVIIPAPHWVSYPDIVRVAGGTPVIVPTRADKGFLLAPEDL